MTGDGNFLAALSRAIRTNGAPFEFAHVDHVEDGWKFDEGDFAAVKLEGVVVLEDGRRFRVEGWCDTTGWDCQSDLECELLS